MPQAIEIAALQGKDSNSLWSAGEYYGAHPPFPATPKPAVGQWAILDKRMARVLSLGNWPGEFDLFLGVEPILLPNSLAPTGINAWGASFYNGQNFRLLKLAPWISAKFFEGSRSAMIYGDSPVRAGDTLSRLTFQRAFWDRGYHEFINDSMDDLCGAAIRRWTYTVASVVSANAAYAWVELDAAVPEGYGTENELRLGRKATAEIAIGSFRIRVSAKTPGSAANGRTVRMAEDWSTVQGFRVDLVPEGLLVSDAGGSGGETLGDFLDAVLATGNYFAAILEGQPGDSFLWTGTPEFAFSGGIDADPQFEVYYGGADGAFEPVEWFPQPATLALSVGSYAKLGWSALVSGTEIGLRAALAASLDSGRLHCEIGAAAEVSGSLGAELTPARTFVFDIGRGLLFDAAIWLSQNPLYAQPVSAIELKRADTLRVDVVLARDGTPIELPHGATGRWGLKRGHDHGGTYLAADENPAAVGGGDAGVSRLRFSPDLNTAELLAVLEALAETEHSADLLHEIEVALPGGTIASTQEIVARTWKDVIRGGEGLPEPLGATNAFDGGGPGTVFPSYDLDGGEPATTYT